MAHQSLAARCKNLKNGENSMYSIPHKLSWYSCIQLVTAVPSYTCPLYCGLYGACRQLLVHICGTQVAHRLWPLSQKSKVTIRVKHKS